MVPEFGGGGFGFVIVGWNPGADRLPGRFDGLEGFDVEWRIGGWRKADKALPETEEAEVGVEKKVVAEGVDGGGGGDASVGEVEADAEGVAEGGCGGIEEKMEEVAAFAEDAAQHSGNGEHELAVRDGMADGVGDPCAGTEGAALVAGGAEVAGLAGEGEEVLVAAVGTEESGEAGGEVAAAEKVFDVYDGLGTQGAHGGTVVFLVTGEEFFPDAAGRFAKAMKPAGGGDGGGRACRIMVGSLVGYAVISSERAGF